MTFTGRLEPRQWTDRDANARTSIEVHTVELEYGAKPGATALRRNGDRDNLTGGHAHGCTALINERLRA